MKKKLVLFTSVYPYGNKSETFLETELDYLCEAYSKVYVIPSKKEEGMRKVPENAIVSNLLTDISQTERKRRLVKDIFNALSIYFFSLFQKGNFSIYIRYAKLYLDLIALSSQKVELLLKFIRQENIENATFYDYWYQNSTLALAFLKKKGKIKTLVSRVHSFDLYDVRWHGAKVPFREYKIANMDKVYAISQHGQHYLQDKTPNHKNKVALSYLGVEKAPKNHENVRGKNTIPLLVSCSSLLSFKRVDRIIDVLHHIDIPVKWVHFGSGSLENQVTSKAKQLPEHIIYELKGHVDNRAVLKYYENHKVDLFISMSIQEGLPVSMMECISYGIPVIACDVYGIPELVNETTGVLVGIEDTAESIAEKVKKMLQYPFDGGNIKKFFNEHFEARKNYRSFIAQLESLSS